MGNFLHHLFVPHHQNNHRAKILHNSSILLLIIVLFIFNFATLAFKRSHPEVLGIFYSVSERELLVLTNKVREENKLAPLSLNDKLRNAAGFKAKDMFARNYWAHFAPDGTTPWEFIKNSGYNYVYAGENLAKGFTSSEEVIQAWMNSPTHRENILSSKYTDIGFSISEGDLLGEDTVVIVETFGSEEAPQIASLPPAIMEKTARTLPLVNQNPAPAPVLGQGGKVTTPNKNIVLTKPMVNISSASKTLLFPLFSILLFAFIIDLIIIERRKIPRLVGHNFDHIMLILLFIVTLLLQRNGFIF